MSKEKPVINKEILNKQMVDGYKAMAAENLKIAQGFETLDN